MNEYLHPNGQTYTEDQLNTAAKKQSITLDEYIRKSKVKLVEKKEKAVDKKSAASSTRVNPWDEKPVNPADAVVGPKKKVSAPVKEKPKPVVAPALQKKVDGDLVIWEDLQGPEEVVQKKIENKLALYGLKPEQTGLGDYMTIRGAGGELLGKTQGVEGGTEMAADLAPVPVGGVVFKTSKEDLANSAKQLNNYIKTYGNKNYASEALNKYGKQLRKMDSVVKSLSRTPEQKQKVYIGDLEDKFKAAETPDITGVASGGLTMGTTANIANREKITLKEKDFTGELEGQYENYKRWKAGMPMAMPSESELENFIHAKNQDEKELLATKYMSNLKPGERTALTAINVNREKTYNKILKGQTDLENELGFFKIEVEEFNKNPSNPAERKKLMDKAALLQNRTDDFVAYASQNRVDVNSLKAQMKAGFASYDRLEQVATGLKSTATGLVYGAAELGSVALAATGAVLSGKDTFSNNYSFLKRNVLDPIYGVKADLGKEAEGFQRDLKVSEISDLEDVGRWTASVLTQAPSSAAMALTGEFSMPLFFLSGIGEKRFEIEKEKYDATVRIKENTELLAKGGLSADDERMAMQQIFDDKKLLAIPEGVNIASEVLSGGAEVLFERLGTLSILKNTGNILKSLPEVTLKKTLKQVGKQFVTSIPEEGLTEGATQVTNNFGDIYLRGKKTMNMFDNVVDASLAGGVMGPGFAAMGSVSPITQALQSEVRTKQERQDRQALLDKIKQITGQVVGDNVSANQIKNDPTIKAEVKDIVLQMIGKVGELDQAAMNRLANTLDYEKAHRVGEINARVRAINDAMAKAAMQYSNDGLTGVELKGIKDHYEAEYTELDKEKDNILMQGATGKTKVQVGEELTKTKDNFDFSVNAGYNLYTAALLSKTKLEVAKKWSASDKETKRKYYEQAELNAGKTLTKEELETQASELFVNEDFKKQINADADATRKMMEALGINNSLTLVDNKAADLNNPDAKPTSARVQMYEVVKSEYKKGNINTVQYKKALSDIRSGTMNAFVTKGGAMYVNVHASAENGKVSPSSHELLHNIVYNKFGTDSATANKAGENLLSYLEKYNPEYFVIVEQQMKAYVDKKTGEKAYDYGEEVMNALSDAFRDKTPSPSVLRQVGEYLSKLASGKFFNINTFDPTDIDSTNGRSVYEFVKSYSEGIRRKEEGRNVKIKNTRLNASVDDNETEETQPRRLAQSKSLQTRLDDLKDSYELGEIDDYEYEQKTNAIEKQMAVEAAKKPSTQGKTIQQRMDDLDDQLYNDDIDYDTYEAKMDALVKEEKQGPKPVVKEEPKAEVKKETKPVKKEKKEESLEDEAKAVMLENKGKIASEKVQEIYNKKGVGGADEIIKLFAPIVDKLVDKRKDAPGFERSLLKDEINTGKGGLLDLIIAYNPKDGVPLAAYINKYLPVRAITASRRVLDDQFSKDVTEQKDLMASETADQGMRTSLPEKPKYTTILESNILDKETLTSIKDKVTREIRVLKSKINEPVSINRTVSPLIKDILEAMGSQADIDIKKFLGVVAEGELKRNLLKFKKVVLENMTTTFLAGKDNGKEVLGGIPQAIQKSVGGRWLSYPEWVGKNVDRESTSTDLAGRTSGHLLIRRTPNVNNFVTNEEYIGQFIGPDGKVLRGRKEAISKAIGEEVSLDIVIDDFLNDGPISDAFVANQAKHIEATKDILEAEFKRQSERGNIKFSSSLGARQTIQLYNAIKNSMDKNTGSFKADVRVIIDDKDSAFNDIAERLINKLTKPAEREKRRVVIQNFKKELLSTPHMARLLTKLRELNESVAANVAEKKVLAAVKSNISFIKKSIEAKSGEKADVKILSTSKTAYDSTKVDLEVGIGKGKGSIVLKMEIKANENAQFSSFTVEDPRSPESNKNKIYADITMSTGENFSDIAKNDPGFKEYLSYAEQTGPGNYILSKDEYYRLQDEKIQRKATFSREIQGNLVLDLYGEKGIDLVTIDGVLLAIDKGLGEKLGIPYLGDYNFNLAVRVAKKSDKDNIITFGFRAFPTLTAESKKKFKTEQVKDGTLSILDDTVGSKTKVADIFGEIYKQKALLQAINKSVAVGIKAIAQQQVESMTNNGEVKKIRVFDFDDTLAQTKSNVYYTMPDGYRGILTAAEFAKDGGDLAADGAEFDFSDFSQVKEGTKGPLFDVAKTISDKTSGEVFILTARPANSAGPIHEFLKSLGLNIPVENITGLGNSSPQAKADWLVQKAADGYNDFYFADDQLANVAAVKTALSDLNIKSRAQQAKPKSGLFNSEQVKSLKEEIELNYNATLKLGKENNDIRTSLFNYDSPISQKISNGVDLRITEGLIRDNKKTYLLYADGNPVGEFKSVADAKGTVKFIEDNLIKPIEIQEGTGNIKFSKSLDTKFNTMIARDKGISPAIRYSDITAKRQGAKKGRLRFFVPPSAEDFAGLLYNFLGKGAQGEKDMEFFNKTLIDPYWKGVRAIDSARQSLKKDFKYLSAAFPNASAKLKKIIPNEQFTYDQAVRVYLWEKEGKEIPGISKRDKTVLIRVVNNDPELKKFANGLETINPAQDGWTDPSEFWDSKTIVSELYELTEKVGRKKFLKTFIENSEVIFSDQNMNKIEALYGTKFREALEDILYRMKNGSNRSIGSSRIVNLWTNWVNDSTGVIMFLNAKSAILQTLGAINYLNMSDNNPIAAAMAFANFKQYAADFAKIISSDEINERREGLKGDVSAAEIANAAATSKNKLAAVKNYLLTIGFTPTQVADAFAIAVGGASFYRNRVNTYKAEMVEKDGVSVRRHTDEKAEELAWRDFTKTTEETQQSSDPALISQQQASVLGRMVLAFNNTGMQYNRLIKKSFRDLKNGRGDAKTHIGKIIYYGAIQNIIFTTLQKALFATMFDEDEEGEEELTLSQKKKKEEQKAKEESKIFEMVNDMGDTILRGTGLTGAVLTVLKNTIRMYVEQSNKDNGDQAKTLLQMLNISPPIGSKVAKVYSAINIAKYDKDVIAKMGGSVTIDGKLNISPAYQIGGKLISAATNIPADRIVTKVNNIAEALDNRNSALQRTALMLGWSPYSLKVENEEQEGLKEEAKTEKKKDKFTLSKEDVRALPLEERKEYMRGKMKKRIEDRKAKLKEKREELKKRKKLYE